MGRARQPGPTDTDDTCWGLTPSRNRLRKIEPYRQGELDSLCGIYAIINALAALCPEMDGEAATILFRKLVRALGSHVPRALGALYDGMSQEAIEALLAVASRETERILEIRLRSRRLVAPERPTLPALWTLLRDEISPRQVAIVGLSGADDHWTVAYAVTDKLIRLVDSTERHVLLRSRCTTAAARTRFRIDPDAVILVKRLKDTASD